MQDRWHHHVTLLQQALFFHGTCPSSCALNCWLAALSEHHELNRCAWLAMGQLDAVQSGGMGALLMFKPTQTHTFISTMDIIAIIGTSDQPCWLAKASKSLLFLVEARGGGLGSRCNIAKRNELCHVMQYCAHSNVMRSLLETSYTPKGSCFIQNHSKEHQRA